MDLLELSGKSQEDIKQISTGEVKRTGGYTLDAFFTKDMPMMTNEKGNYEIGRVEFTREELIQIRGVLKAATDGIGLGAGKNINLDYRDYAAMSLAENAVEDYAKSHFSEVRASVVSKTMKEYNAGLVELQDTYINASNTVKNDYGSLSEYYGLKHKQTKEEADAFNKMKEELSKITGMPYNKSVPGDGGLIQTATNVELIGEISDIFKNVDLTDAAAVEKAMEKYQQLVRPAYQALTSSSKQAGADVKNFQAMLKNIQLSMGYRSIDFSV
ncbi:MAG: hypothetical protein NC307_14665 [Roseburia sp.]|nr:hypothetical protein [Roseburia sp.]